MSDVLSIYLDESGDLGFNFANKGTPRYFIIGLLVCENKSAINQFKKAVERTLKNKVKTSDGGSRELKGSNSTLAIKKYFYKHAEESKDWHVYGIVLDKHKLKNKTQSLPHENKIYNYLTREILARVSLEAIKSRFVLVVDKGKGRHGMSEFNKYIATHLEARMPLNVLRNISHEESHKNPMLQAVDMFCWGIRKFYEHKDNSWISVYENRLTLIEENNFTDIK